MHRFVTALLVLTAFAPPASIRAQDDEEAAVQAVVNRLFDSMRAGDSAGVRSTFHPQARLVSVSERDGQPMIHVEENMDGFVQAVGTPHDEVWDERLDDVEIQIDGRLAVYWAEYTFYLGDRLSHCGVDAFQLAKGADGWKIIQGSDTRRRENCEALPPSE